MTQNLISGFNGVTEKIINKLNNQNLDWVASTMDASKKFFIEHKEMVISALAISVFLLWTKKSDKTVDTY